MENHTSKPPAIGNVDRCVVHSYAGQKIDPELVALLDPINHASMHQYTLPAREPVALHYHDMDEYWWFTSGTPLVTLWTPASGLREYHLKAGDMVACLRGVAHTLWADHVLVYYQFSSALRPGVRRGHIVEGLPAFNPDRGGKI